MWPYSSFVALWYASESVVIFAFLVTAEFAKKISCFSALCSLSVRLASTTFLTIRQSNRCCILKKVREARCSTARPRYRMVPAKFWYSNVSYRSAFPSTLISLLEVRSIGFRHWKYCGVLIVAPWSVSKISHPKNLRFSALGTEPSSKRCCRLWMKSQ